MTELREFARRSSDLNRLGVVLVPISVDDQEAAHGGTDIALRTTLLIDPEGRERWRRVSKSVPDIPTADETLSDVTKAQEQERGVAKDH